MTGKKGKSGRKRKSYSFEEAKTRVQNEGISSVVEYAQWWELNKPARMPKRPDRAYKQQFTTWNDFLGLNNVFPFHPRNYIPYKQAKAFAHTLNLKSRDEWLEYCKKGTKPDNIPIRPDVKYRKTGEWFSWKDFLGYSLEDKLEFAKTITDILYIFKSNGGPRNLYRIGKIKNTKEYVIDYALKNDETIIAIFNYDSAVNVKSIVMKYGSEYAFKSTGDEYLINNIHGLLFDLDSVMVKI
jgi:hypothetical protein